MWLIFEGLDHSQDRDKTLQIQSIRGFKDQLDNNPVYGIFLIIPVIIGPVGVLAKSFAEEVLIGLMGIHGWMSEEKA